MGQAVGQLEPPSVADPLDGAMSTGSPPADGHADDLLSELAGAEIDRMLAAADVESPTSAVPPPPPVVVAPPVEIPAPVVAAPVAPVESSKVETAPAAAEPAVVTAAPTEPPAPVVADLAAVLAEASVERPVVSATSADLDLGNPIARTPFLLRPLAFINAPLDMLPDTVRDTIGKVAVVTLVNSAAIIAYLMIFRRHHG